MIRSRPRAGRIRCPVAPSVVAEQGEGGAAKAETPVLVLGLVRPVPVARKVKNDAMTVIRAVTNRRVAANRTR